MDPNPQPRAFYRVIMREEQLQTIRLPLAYVLIDEDAHTQARLWSRSNQEHEVKVDKDEDGLFWLTQGWHDFTQANRVNVGSALIFTYMGDSIFEVDVVSPDSEENGEIGRP